MTATILLGSLPIAALDPTMMVPALTMVGALLVGALVIAFFRRWQQRTRPLGPSASDQLAQFRQLYEQGAISEEEFKRLRAVLGSEIRRASALPDRPAEPAPPPDETTRPTLPPGEPPVEPGPSPSEGIRPG